jgi:hypothetical protein
MYEYGCFDGVMESSGTRNAEVRNSIEFPKPRTHDGKPLYLSDGKFYYIDLNGAYLSFIDGIPLNLDEGCARNYKINELIQRMFNARNWLKGKNSPLEKTVKVMLTSLYGNSITKPKFLKNKFSTNVKKHVEDYLSYIAKYRFMNDKEGYTSKVQCFSPHFSHPQLAKSMYDNYYQFFEKIGKLVKIYYINTDAILVDEDGYNKLLELGYVGDELGKFKIEAVFKEIAIKSGLKRFGILDNGEFYRKCVKDDVKYEEFVQSCSELCS